MLAQTENIFYGFSTSVTFVRDANGTVTQAIVHYSLPQDCMMIQIKIK
ncbi:hypothetical protein BH10ACI1_BH10ACI1_26530 [soil metagenome]